MKLQKLIGWTVILFQMIGPGLPMGLRSIASEQSVQAPVLKWQKGGCYSSWCETAWYSSPAVADLDGDGTMEVIGGTYTVFILNGENGSVQRSMDPLGSRVWPGVVVADVDGDGDLEIVTAHGDGYVNLFNNAGDLLWSRRPDSNELRSLAVADLEGDGRMEIVVGQAKLNKVNVWVYEPDGNLRPGWPQLADNEGSAAGIYNNNIALGDVDGDGVSEVVVPSDTITICAYEPDGAHLSTNVMYHDQPGHDMDHWGEVPAYVDLAYEVQGYGPCYTEFTARANFADGPANIADVNEDGVNEVVAIGNVHDCHTTPNYTDLYNTPYIFNADRSRFNAGGFDWTTPPVNTGAPIKEDYDVIESVMPNPVTVDLDGDGKLEILYASYDGRMHAFWLDKTEHGNWPYSVYHSSEGVFRFASEPVVADLDNDGHPEVLFGSWAQKGSGRTGKLHILDYLGNPLREVDLPASFGGNWNGALAAPTLANIDADADLEIVLNTSSSGFVAYDLPGTAGARLWGTGRGSYQRTGAALYGSLLQSSVSVSPVLPGPGDNLTYTIRLENPGPVLENVHVTDSLSADVSYLGDLWASSGTYAEAGGVITWSGRVESSSPVTITFSAVVGAQITTPTVITNMAGLDDGWGHVLVRQATVIANGYGIYIPLASK